MGLATMACVVGPTTHGKVNIGVQFTVYRFDLLEFARIFLEFKFAQLALGNDGSRFIHFV
jgi:hypothetical protein